MRPWLQESKYTFLVRGLDKIVDVVALLYKSSKAPDSSYVGDQSSSTCVFHLVKNVAAPISIIMSTCQPAERGEGKVKAYFSIYTHV